MNGKATMFPKICEGGDFIVEIQDPSNTCWIKSIIPSDCEPSLRGKTHSFSDFVHAQIFADLLQQAINQPTRVNARKVCYIHFKSHHLAPDTWYLFHSNDPFKDLRSAIEGCEDLMRTGHITETRVSFEKDTKIPGCYYPQGRSDSVQVQFGEGADDGESIQTDRDHSA